MERERERKKREREREGERKIKKERSHEPECRHAQRGYRKERSTRKCIFIGPNE